MCLVTLEAKRGHWNPWNWRCELSRGSWEWNLGVLEDQPVPLITELSLKPLFCPQTLCLWFSPLCYAFFSMIIK
ncbi:rCG61510 [Rattus norvegicus]|uniref:RCG61510 n=1 Tax=Rattus norvegicus TaxID=10116 RepID=A6HC65_RAT|nr:rCG61510 [Rattus norvegicus]